MSPTRTPEPERISRIIQFGSAAAQRELRLSELTVGWKYVREKYRIARERGTSASKASPWRIGLWNSERSEPHRQRSEYLNKKINERFENLFKTIDAV